MSLDTALMESVMPAAVLGIATLIVMLTTLRWWRIRLAAAESRTIRARIALAAPDPHVPPARDPAPRRATTFVGRDRSAIPLE